MARNSLKEILGLQALPLGLAIVSLIVLTFASLSPFTTSAVTFYKNLIIYPIIFIIAAIFIHYITGISIMPIGNHDPDTYPFQAWFGYEGAFKLAVLMGIVTMFFFGISVGTSGQAYLPVQPIFATTITSAPDSNLIFSIWSGGNKMFRGAIDALAATSVENYLFLFPIMMLVWISVRYLLQGAFRIPSPIANLIGMVLGVCISSLMFANFFHAVAYQGITPAYDRITFFAFFVLIQAALTGFPFGADLGHFANNFAASVSSFSVYVGGFLFRKDKTINTKGVKI